MTLLTIGQPTTADKSNDLFPAEPTVEARLAAIIEKHTEQVDDFDWSGDGSIVVEEQPSIAIYLNNRNHVVIRQRAYEEVLLRHHSPAEPNGRYRTSSATWRGLPAWGNGAGEPQAQREAAAIHCSVQAHG